MIARSTQRFAAAIAGSMLAAGNAQGHGIASIDAASPTVWLYGLIAIAALAYVRGLFNLWSSARRGHGVSLRGAGAFFIGLGLLAMLVSDAVERLTGVSFAAHMAQHELLMLLVAPLLVAGRPLATWAWALPRSRRGRTAQLFAHPGWRVPWEVLTAPLGAAAMQLLLLLFWHVPAAFDAAVSDPWLHALQHLSFFAPALAFWWALLSARKRFSTVQLVAVFVTMLATGALGALLTFSSRPLYAAYSASAGALEDQQLGGLVMWIPGGLVYLVVALWIVASRLEVKEPGRNVPFPGA